MKPLKPVMTALWAVCFVAAAPVLARAAGSASSELKGAAGASETTAPAPTPTAGKTVAAGCSTDEQNPVNALACLIADPVNQNVRDSIGERLALFVQSSKGPLTQDLRTAPDQAKTLHALAEAAKKWPDAEVKISSTVGSGKVATLYFVLGPNNELPVWALKSDLLTRTLGTSRKAPCLVSAMAKWKGNVSQTGSVSAVSGFLSDAAAQAKEILPRGCSEETKDAAAGSIARHDNTGVSAGSPVYAGKSNPGAPGGDDPNYQSVGMYETGVEKGSIIARGDNGPRTLSMKIYSTRDADGNFINQIGIVDISKGRDGNYLPDANSGVGLVSLMSGETTFPLRTNGRKYTVTIDGDKVTLRRAGSKGDEGTLSTTVSKLMQDRSEQIKYIKDDNGNIVGENGVVTIAGHNYYSIAQGGPRPSAMLFSVDDLRKPVLMGEVSKVLADGDTKPLLDPPGPDIGKLNGIAYHLEYNDITHRWTPVKGPGYVPPKPDKDKDSKAGKEGAGGKKGDSDSGSKSDAPLLSELVKVKFKDFKDNDGAGDDYGNNTINKDMKDRFRVMTDKDGAYYVISPEILPSYSLQLKDNPTFRAYNEWVAVETNGDAVYYALPALVAYSDTSVAKVNAGSYNKAKNHMEAATDIDVAADILATYMKHPVDLKPGVDKYAPEGSYAITAQGGAGDKLIVTITNTKTNKDCQLLPDLGKCTDSTGKVSQTGKAPEPSADPDGSKEAYKGCREDLSEPNSKTTVLLDKEAGRTSGGTEVNDVCLYEHKTAKMPSSYSLTLYYATENGPTTSTRDIFGETLPKPAQISYKSLGDKTPRSTPHPEIRSVDGSDTSHGVYGLFQSGESSHETVLKDKAGDCLGVVVWWGMSEGDALKACQERIIQAPASWKNAWHIFG